MFYFVERKFLWKKKFVFCVFRDMAPVQRPLKCWMRVPRRVPPRWIRLHMYRVNRERYLLRSRAAAVTPSRVVIDDIPTEIMVKIFNYVLSSQDNDYNIALPKVCSRWARIMYGFVYVHGFPRCRLRRFFKEATLSIRGHAGRVGI